MSFPKTDPKQSFPKLEEEILAYWEKEKMFEKSLEKDSPKGEFKFFDGPPFATGLPHYGHILQGVIKDLIPRYKTMQGYNVPRVWGWDCHGLPVENLIEKDLGLKSKQDVEKYGVDKFNEKCRESVLKYAEEWKKTVKRMGRWIDMENAYKTMDLEYMDSVWWVFGELWKKGLIYEGLKPMHICPRCETPLSNFEVGLGYKDITDLSATVKFELDSDSSANPAVNGEDTESSGKTYLLAWTTTPWTLLGNVALAVNPKVEYVKVTAGKEDILVEKRPLTKMPNQSWEHFKTLVEDDELKTQGATKSNSAELFRNPNFFEEKLKGGKGVLFKKNEYYWIAKDLLSFDIKTHYGAAPEIIETIKGSELIGKTYKPLFPQFASKKDEGAFKIVGGDFVTTDEGTGIVHIAPAFGEDDYEVAKKENLPIIQHVSLDGKFVDEVGELTGLEVKPAKNPRETDEKVVDLLEKEGKLFSKENYKHSYPHCWRCETPLLNYATSSWFVKVEEIKKDLIKNNQEINWIPAHIRDGRFGKWLEGARDWAISRNRFWGAPLPIWRCEKCEETVCVKSKEELEKLSGEKVEDLHKHFVDKVELKCKCGEKMQRIPEVLDCWFESGSMPYASQYAANSSQFAEKNKNSSADCKLKTANCIADFIGEAQDQTRGWFYTLHVLAGALTNKSAFRNCTCTGLVLAEDGEKMSKSKQNFPPPQKILDNYGADAMRLYLMQSPVTHAEDLRFSERGVEETLRSVLLPLWNTFYFFTTYANADGWEPKQLADDSRQSADFKLRKIGSNEKNPPAANCKLQTANSLDAWVISELNILIREMSEHLEAYEIQKAVSPLAKFLDGLTNWYVRRSRRRFWRPALRNSKSEEGKSESDSDKNEAYATLLHVLTEVSKLLAPICPFIAEKIYRDLTDGESVHLVEWPKADESRIDEELSKEVDTTRKIISLGLAIRAREKIKVRQPLQKVIVAVPSVHIGENVLAEQRVGLNTQEAKNTILEELNVKEFMVALNTSEIAEEYVKVDARIVGKRLGSKVQETIKLAKEGKFEITKDGLKIGNEILNGKEAKIEYKAREGKAVESDSGIVVALDTTITPELELEGKARDLVRVIQDLRKKADYDVSDRIELQLEGAAEILKAHEKYIAAETLAEKVSQKLNSPDAEGKLEGIKIGVKKS